MLGIGVSKEILSYDCFPVHISSTEYSYGEWVVVALRNIAAAFGQLVGEV